VAPLAYFVNAIDPDDMRIPRGRAWLAGAFVLSREKPVRSLTMVVGRRWVLPLLSVFGLAWPAGAHAGDLVFVQHGIVGPASRLAAGAAGYWGGEYRTTTGEKVTVYLSDDYVQNEENVDGNQNVANFLASAIHGPELEKVTIFRGTTDEIDAVCGVHALACYSYTERAIYTPAQPVTGRISAEGALLHEYGHHVAGARRNDPWKAIDFGTKRWASNENVCALWKRHVVFPGDEDEHYELNPGEGFAETYRVLNERRLGLSETPWRVVSDRFSPDATDLRAVTQDVLSPWTRPTTTTIGGRLAVGRERSYTIPTPLDGAFTASVRAGFRLEVLDRSSRLARRIGRVQTTVCGQRSLRVGVTAVRAAGSYRLKLTKP
jgi:hypothetical protein